MPASRQWPCKVLFIRTNATTNGVPLYRATLDRLDPCVVGEEHAEDGDTLVIV